MPPQRRRRNSHSPDYTHNQPASYTHRDDNIANFNRLPLGPCLPDSGCRACSFEAIREHLTTLKRKYRREIRALEAQLPTARDDFFVDARMPMRVEIELRIANLCADWHVEINAGQDKWEREWGPGVDQDAGSGQSVFEIHREIISRRWVVCLPDEITM